MEDYQDSSSSTSSPNTTNTVTPERNESVRSRWNPKPEQILILESIFNSGMVNPPKEETVRIRKLLEKFGSVGDANVFYWFQNRRSRSRRRQRQLQLQASLGPPPAAAHHPQQAAAGAAISSCVFPPSSASYNSAVSSYFPNLLGSSSSSSSSPPCCGGVDDEMLCLSGGETMMSMNSAGLEPASSSITPSSLMSSHDASHLSYQPGLITVFINGVATEVPRGPIDIKAMFGTEDELLLYHSSGIPIPINQFGILLQTLRHGESYFLVSRTA
ncbi:PREDICTED: WUSCHEL-related homeobox 11 [Ipomoea nil]|uniref:WUSCHEL-related homeobox 11 n=1 Tax=Ipomoea nil TaxID=35883 RepID=UPI000901DBE6|nr:PREDICTED: WUSCHEL-related homeobox 11 [Ipomoea nil]